MMLIFNFFFYPTLTKVQSKYRVESFLGIEWSERWAFPNKWQSHIIDLEFSQGKTKHELENISQWDKKYSQEEYDRERLHTFTLWTTTHTLTCIYNFKHLINIWDIWFFWVWIIILTNVSCAIHLLSSMIFSFSDE